jgi:hypothetical protein
MHDTDKQDYLAQAGATHRDRRGAYCSAEKNHRRAGTMAQNQKRKQALECQRWNHAQIDRRDGVGVVE